MKKLMDVEAMLSYLPATEADAFEAGKVVPLWGDHIDESWISYGCKEGLYTGQRVLYNGVHALTYFWLLSNESSLVIVACYATGQVEGNMDKVMEIAFQQKASDLRAKSIEWMTKRRGNVEKALQHGYQIAGVVLRKSTTLL